MLDKKILLSDNSFEITFIYNANFDTAKRFSVRPYSDSGSTSIFDSERKIWISSTDLWSAMPYLENDMKIKIDSLGGVANIYFVIQDLKTSVLYQTPIKKIWSRELFNQYLSKLNYQILRWENDSAIDTYETTDSTILIEEAEKSPYRVKSSMVSKITTLIKNPDILSIFITIVIVFTGCTLTGYLFYKRR